MAPSDGELIRKAKRPSGDANLIGESSSSASSAKPTATKLNRRAGKIRRCMRTWVSGTPTFANAEPRRESSLGLQLPDLYPGVVGAVHLVAGFDAEGVVERHHVSYRTGDAEEAGGMDVGLDADGEVLWTDLIHPT